MSSSLILCNNNEPFLDWIVWCLKKSGYFKIIISDDQLSGWTKKKLQWTSQSRTCTKKRSWSLFSGLLPIWSTTAFWILMKQLHIWEIHSANSWDAPKTSVPAASVHQQNEPNSSPQQCLTAHHTTNASKVEQIGLRFASSTINTWPLANQLPLLQASWPLFCRKSGSTTSRMQKMLSKSSSNPKAQVFNAKKEYNRNKQAYFSLASICCF